MLVEIESQSESAPLSHQLGVTRRRGPKGQDIQVDVDSAETTSRFPPKRAQKKKSLALVVYTHLLLFVVGSLFYYKYTVVAFFRAGNKGIPSSSFLLGAKESDPAEDEKNCGFQNYRHPLHHEGLPRLVETFHADDSVYFAALNEGICEPEWRGAQNFSSSDRFICEFADGTRVSSDPVPPTEGDVWTSAILMIRCPIPSHIQKVLSPSSTLILTLQATVDLEAGRHYGPTNSKGNDAEDHYEEPEWEYPSANSLGAYRDIKVCPREWPDGKRQDKAYKSPLTQNNNNNNKWTLSMTAQILMEYETFELKDRKRVTIPPINIITWLEYNLLIGFEHFYIFDNDPRKHGPLEHLLDPYIKAGTVTYVWYPMQDCHRKANDELDGSRMTISQAFSSTTSLRRYAHQTEFMGHFDIDEYIQLPPNVTDIKNLLQTMPNQKLTLFLEQKWYHECKQRRMLNVATHKTPNLFPLDQQFCVSPDTTPGKSIMKTNDILAFFVHSPWVKTDHTLFDWDKEAMEIDNLFIAHTRTRRARDGVPIKVLDEPKPLIARDDLQQALQVQVNNKMQTFQNPGN